MKKLVLSLLLAATLAPNAFGMFDKGSTPVYLVPEDPDQEKLDPTDTFDNFEKRMEDIDKQIEMLEIGPDRKSSFTSSTDSYSSENSNSPSGSSTSSNSSDDEEEIEKIEIDLTTNTQTFDQFNNYGYLKGFYKTAGLSALGLVGLAGILYELSNWLDATPAKRDIALLKKMLKFENLSVNTFDSLAPLFTIVTTEDQEIMHGFIEKGDLATLDEYAHNTVIPELKKAHDAVAFADRMKNGALGRVSQVRSLCGTAAQQAQKAYGIATAKTKELYDSAKVKAGNLYDSALVKSKRLFKREATAAKA